MSLGIFAARWIRVSMLASGRLSCICSCSLQLLVSRAAGDRKSNGRVTTQEGPKMSTKMRNATFSLSAAMILCLLFAVGASAQVKTDTASTSGQPKVETQVERGEVVTVNGNDLIVKMEDGSLRHFANVPESAKVTVDGKELGIHDLKPGMKLERTITTTTTPKTITTTQTVTGT